MDRLSKKELYKERKQQKIEAKEIQRKERRKSRFIFALSIGVPLIAVALTVMYGVYGSSSVNIPEIGQAFPDQGREHIGEGAKHPPYNSNPPTSGWHYEEPARWGVYKEELPQEQLVHNLEHGGIIIQYHPDLEREIAAKLEDIKTSEFECKVVVAPYSAMDSRIALSAWGRLYTSDTFDEETIRNFIRKYRNSGPEGFIPCNADTDHAD